VVGTNKLKKQTKKKEREQQKREEGKERFESGLKSKFWVGRRNRWRELIWSLREQGSGQEGAREA